jgi:plasmid maintenance system antidote protein VapI
MARNGMRLARYFGGDAHSWLTLQLNFDLRIAREVTFAERVFPGPLAQNSAGPL